MQSQNKKKLKKSIKSSDEDISLERIISLGGSADDLDLIKDLNQNTKKKKSSNIKEQEIQAVIKDLGLNKENKTIKNKPVEDRSKTKGQNVKKKKSTNYQKTDVENTNHTSLKTYSKNAIKFTDRFDEAISIPSTFSHLNLPNQTLIPSTSVWYQSPLSEITDISEDNLKNAEILREYGLALHKNEIKIYKTKNGQNVNNNKWVQTAASVGTSKDRITAASYLFQESPIHNINNFELLVNLSLEEGKRHTYDGLNAVRELLHSNLLPDNRKLRKFTQYPLQKVYRSLLENKDEALWSVEYCQRCLIMWIFEDRFKTMIAKYVDCIRNLSQHSTKKLKLQAMGTAFQLLKSKPEQEKQFLELLVNKIGDPFDNISSKAVDMLQRIVHNHPMMQAVVIKTVRDFLLIPSLPKKAQYFCIIFLTSQILSKENKEIALNLINIYMNFFKSLSAKTMETEDNKNNKLMFALLTGVKRAFPYACMEDEAIVREIKHLFFAAHSPQLNTAIQSLRVLYQVYESRDDVPDRYYNALYSLLFHDQMSVSLHRHTMVVTLLFKSLKRDISENRVAAFLKRALQIASLHSPPLIAAILTTMSELMRANPAYATRVLTTKDNSKGRKPTQSNDEDEEEQFFDVIEDSTEKKPNKKQKSTPKSAWVHKKVDVKEKRHDVYDPLCRCPQYSGVENASFWELHSLVRHYHPSVSLYAKTILTPGGTSKSFTGDPIKDYTNIRFLDRFVYRNPKNKHTIKTDVVKYYGVHSRERYFNPKLNEPVNTTEFMEKSDYHPEEAFFQKYFSLPSMQSRLRKPGKISEDPIDDEFEDLLDDGSDQKVDNVRFSDHISKSGVSKDEMDQMEEGSDDSDDDLNDDDDDDDELPKEEVDGFNSEAGFFECDGGSQKRKAKKSNSINPKRIKKAGDEFGRILEENADDDVDTTMSSSVVNKSKASSKQLRWERKRELSDILEKKRERKQKSGRRNARRGGKFPNKRRARS